jgi:hypothetical protein
MTLPTQYQEYYVYAHKDPDTGEIVYIGHGRGSRAWHFNSYRRRTTDTSRDKEHNDWASSLIQEGFLPCDFVVVLCRNLSKSDACKVEQQLIRKQQPRFNKSLGKSLLKFNEDDVAFMHTLRMYGMSFNKIAKEMGASTMTVWRTLTGANKNVV